MGTHTQKHLTNFIRESFVSWANGSLLGVISLPIEAKCIDIHKSLSKHKLVYPILAVADNVPNNIPIVPVYLKIHKREAELHYHTVECEYPDPRDSIRSIDELAFKKHSQYILKLGK